MRLTHAEVRENLFRYIANIIHGDIVLRRTETYVVKRSFPQAIAGINVLATASDGSRDPHVFSQRLEKVVNGRLGKEEVHIAVSCLNDSIKIVATLVRAHHCPDAHQKCPDHQRTCAVHMAA